MKKIFKLFSAVCLAAFLFAPLGFGATYTDFVTGNAQVSQPAFDPGPNSKYVFIQARRINLGDADFNGGSGVTNGDVVQLLTVPDNTIVREFGVRVTTVALTAGASMYVGTGDDTDSFVTTGGIALTTTGAATTGSSVFQLVGNTTVLAAQQSGAYFTGSGVSPFVGGDTIDAVIQTDPANPSNGGASGVTPVFEVWAVMQRLPTY